MIRRAEEEDLSSILSLLDAAFSPSMFESALVKRVRASGEDYYDWVIEVEGEVVGYVLYTLATRDETPVGWHLAPVAVHPDHHKQGLGSLLIKQTLEESPLVDEPVFVLGDPGYYERFGFEEVSSALCPYDPGNQHFRALRWSDNGEAFTVGYSNAFSVEE